MDLNANDLTPAPWPVLASHCPPDLLVGFAALAPNAAPPIGPASVTLDFPAKPHDQRDAHRGGGSYEASMLRNLLARIHGDGGHYVEQHGLDKALADADEMVAGWRAAQPAEPLYDGLTLDQVKERLAVLGADDLRGLVVSLLIQQQIAERAFAATQPA